MPKVPLAPRPAPRLRPSPSRTPLLQLRTTALPHPTHPNQDIHSRRTASPHLPRSSNGQASGLTTIPPIRTLLRQASPPTPLRQTRVRTSPRRRPATTADTPHNHLDKSRHLGGQKSGLLHNAQTPPRPLLPPYVRQLGRATPCRQALRPHPQQQYRQQHPGPHPHPHPQWPRPSFLPLPASIF